MKKGDLIKFVFLSVIVSNISITICCSPLRRNVNSKKDYENDRLKRGLPIHIPYNEYGTNFNSNEEISAENQNIFSKNFNEQELNTITEKQSDEHFKSENYMFPDIRVKFTDHSKNVIGIHSDLYKTKRNINNPYLRSVVVGRENVSQKQKKKNYSCYCKEPDCTSPQCIENESLNQIVPKEKSMYYNDAYSKDISTAYEDKPIFDLQNSDKLYRLNPNKIFATKRTKFNMQSNDNLDKINQNIINTHPIEDQPIEPIQGDTIYLPIYSAIQSKKNLNAYNNKQNQELQKYSTQPLRTTTPKQITIEEQKIEDLSSSKLQLPRYNNIDVKSRESIQRYDIPIPTIATLQFDRQNMQQNIASTIIPTTSSYSNMLNSNFQIFQRNLKNNYEHNFVSSTRTYESTYQNTLVKNTDNKDFLNKDDLLVNDRSSANLNKENITLNFNEKQTQQNSESSASSKSSRGIISELIKFISSKTAKTKTSPQPITTLEDVENEEYKNHFKIPRSTTLKDANISASNQTSEGSKLKSYEHSKDSNPQTISENSQKAIDESGPILTKQFTKQPKDTLDMKVNKKITTTESSIQTVDERPSILNENSIESLNHRSFIYNAHHNNPVSDNQITILPDFVNTESYQTTTVMKANDHFERLLPNASNFVQKAIQKVINNFVPGKAEDLLANYNKKDLPEIINSSVEKLHPEILDSPALKNLFSLPEVEDMITDTASNFLTHLTNLTVNDVVHKSIKDSLHNVINRIPRSHSIKAPILINSYEDHKLYDGNYLPTTSDPLERVSNKLKSILRRLELEKLGAIDPFTQNVIVKTVKHSLDKEQGVIDETTIRQVLDSIVKAAESADSVTQKVSIINVTEHILSSDLWMVTQNTVQTYTNELPHVSEHGLNNDLWMVTQTNAIQTYPNELPHITESKPNYEIQTEWTYPEHTIGYDANAEKMENVSHIKHNNVNKNESQEKLDHSIERKPIKYYSPGNTIFEYMKNHQTTDNSRTTSTSNSVDSTYKHINEIETVSDSSQNNHQTPSRYQDFEISTKQSISQFDTVFKNQLNEAESELQDPRYFGRLVRVNYTNSPRIKDANELQGSNFVYIGDGVKLPLTIRTLDNGSLVLTLSDEVCKQYTYRKCPCCLPNSPNGSIIREKGSDTDTKNHDFVDKMNRIKKSIDVKKKLKKNNNLILAFIADDMDPVTKSSVKKIKINNNNNNSDIKTIKNNDKIDRENWLNYQGYGPPYKYQRYAVEDEAIRSRTEIIKNMLIWIKNIVSPTKKKM